MKMMAEVLPKDQDEHLLDTIWRLARQEYFRCMCFFHSYRTHAKACTYLPCSLCLCMCFFHSHKYMLNRAPMCYIQFTFVSNTPLFSFSFSLFVSEVQWILTAPLLLSSVSQSVNQSISQSLNQSRQLLFTGVIADKETAPFPPHPPAAQVRCLLPMSVCSCRPCTCLRR